jgi:hypothetical protein
VQNKNPTWFQYKKEIKTKQGYDKKTYQKLVLNILKVMGNSTLIYTHWAPSLRKFLISNLHVAHAFPCVN